MVITRIKYPKNERQRDFNRLYVEIKVSVQAGFSLRMLVSEETLFHEIDNKKIQIDNKNYWLKGDFH